MKRLILLVLLATCLFPVAANAQVLELTTWPNAAVIEAASNPDVSTKTLAVTDSDTVTTTSDRPTVPDPPVGLGRASIPCGGARLCPGQSPVPVSRPIVPPLVTLTTDLVLEGIGSCYVRFTADLAGNATGDYVTFDVRATGSIGSYVTAFATYTLQGNAVVLAPAKFSAGEWQATDRTTGERSNVTLVSNALPLICGA